VTVAACTASANALSSASAALGAVSVAAVAADATLRRIAAAAVSPVAVSTCAAIAREKTVAVFNVTASVVVVAATAAAESTRKTARSASSAVALAGVAVQVKLIVSPPAAATNGTTHGATPHATGGPASSVSVPLAVHVFPAPLTSFVRSLPRAIIGSQLCRLARRCGRMECISCKISAAVKAADQILTCARRPFSHSEY